MYTVYIQNTVYVLYGIICILYPTWHVDTRPPTILYLGLAYWPRWLAWLFAPPLARHNNFPKVERFFQLYHESWTIFSTFSAYVLCVNVHSTQYTVHSISVFPDKIIGMVPYHTVGSATVYSRKNSESNPLMGERRIRNKSTNIIGKPSKRRTHLRRCSSRDGTQRHIKRRFFINHTTSTKLDVNSSLEYTAKTTEVWSLHHV